MCGLMTDYIAMGDTLKDAPLDNTHLGYTASNMGLPVKQPSPKSSSSF